MIRSAARSVDRCCAKPVHRQFKLGFIEVGGEVGIFEIDLKYGSCDHRSEEPKGIRIGKTQTYMHNYGFQASYVRQSNNRGF